MSTFAPSRCLALALLLLCLIQTGFAQQLAITWPKDGAVFQQRADGKANVILMGFFNSRSWKIARYTVTATLEKLNLQTGAPEGTVRSFTLPARDPALTLFGQTMTDIDKGWYRLTVRGVYTYLIGPPRQAFISSIKFGVGEVFIIAGQSNAQGLPNTSVENKVAEPANGQNYVFDGVRVNIQTNPDAKAALTAIGNPTNIAQLNRLIYKDKIVPYKSVAEAANNINSGIGPMGSSLWYWARLGERIAQQRQVPVAFYNAAVGGTTITDWARSTDNTKRVEGRGPGPNPNNPWPPPGAGSPYKVLSNTIKLYASLYGGVKAVLWMQGETDTQALSVDPNDFSSVTVTNWNNSVDTYNRSISGSVDYAQKLNQVITKTRQETGLPNLPWIIARASLYTNVKNQTVIDGQNAVINQNNYVYAGPMMDNLDQPSQRRAANDPDGTAYGPEPTHLKGRTTGLKQAADAWYDQLVGPGNLLNLIPPATLAQSQAQPIMVYNNGAFFTAPAGGSQYSWMDESYVDGSADPNFPVSTSPSISVGCTNCAAQTQNTPGNGNPLRRVLVEKPDGMFIISDALPFPYVDVDDVDNTPPPSGGSNTCKNGNEQSGGNRTPNGTTVGGFGNSSEFMVYTFANVPAAGNYTFSVHYASGDSQAGIDLVVNSTPYQMRPAGTASWTPNATANTTIYLNQGTNTIRIQGSGAGNFTYDQLCVNTGGTPPPNGCSFSVNPSVSNANPACNSGITLLANCLGSDCGSVSFSWSGSNGSSYGGASPSFNAPGTNGSVTYTLTASKGGCSNLAGSTSINVTCGGGTSGLQITSASLNCGSGTVSLNMTGLNGNPVEYKAIGVQDWSTSPLVIPSWQRNGTNFTFYARQAGNNEASISYTTGCAGYRLAAVEPTPNADDELWVSPNPTTGKVVVRFRLEEHQTGALSVVNESGKTLQARPVVGTGRVQDESLELTGQPVGLYVVQLKSGSVLKTAKVLVR